MADGKMTFEVGLKLSSQDVASIKSQLQALQKLTVQDLMGNNSSLGIETAKKDLKEIQQSATQVQKALADAFNPKLNTFNLSKLKDTLNSSNFDIQKIHTNFQKAGSVGTAAFNSLSSSVLKSNVQLRESHSILDKIGETMTNTIKWGITSRVINGMADAIGRAWNYTVKLDSSLNDIRIVTGKSADEMEKFAVQANRAAKDLGASTRDYTNAALIYYQQGLSDEESKKRAEITVKAANVTGQSTRETSEQLTAIWNGYKVDAAEAELYIDKVAKVAATTAADLEEMASGMSKVAAAANTAGVDIDQLNAMLATVVSVTREAPESIGTAFKTIFARLGDLKMGKTDEEGVTLGKVSGQLQALGVQVLDETGNMREMGNIIEDIAAKWENWTQAQKQAVAVAMAGRLQYSRFIALFENWEMYTKAINDSRNAVGELNYENNIYLESTKAHLQQLNTSWERVFDSFVDNKGVNNLIDIFSTLTQGVANLIEALSGGGNALLNLGGIVTQVFSKQIAQSVNATIQNFKALQNNKEQLRSELESLNVLNKQAPGDEGTAVRYNERAEMQSFIGGMNKEEIIEYKKAIDEYGNAVSKLQQYNQDRVATEDFVKRNLNYDKRLNIEKNTNNVMTGEDSSGFERYAEGVEKNRTALNDLVQYIEEAETAYEEYTEKVKENLNAQEQANLKNVEGLEELGYKGEKVLDFYDLFKEKIDQVNNSIQKLTGNTSGLSKSQQEQLGGISKTWKDVDKTTKSYATGSSVKVTDAFKAMKKEAVSAANAYKDEAEKSNKFLQQEADNAYKTKEALKAASDEKQTLLNIQKSGYIDLINIQNLTQAIGLVQSLAATMNTITHLPSIWNNNDLSTGEKILQTTMAFASVAMNLIPIIKSLNAVQQAHNAAKVIGETLNKKVTISTMQEVMWQELLNRAKDDAVVADIKEVAALTASQKAHLMNTYATQAEAEALTQAKVAQDGFNASALANPYLWIVLAVVAAIAAIVLAVKAADNANKATARTAQEAAEQASLMKTELEEATIAAKELRDTINSFDESVKSLDNLRQGTEEYNKAVQQANDEAKKLIETLGLLSDSYSYDSHGVIKFNDGVLENAQKEADEKVTGAKAMSYIADFEVNEANIVYQSDKLAEKIGMVSDVNGVYQEGSYWSDNGWGQRELSPETMTTIVDGLKDSSVLIDKFGAELEQLSDDQLKEAILSIDGLPPAAEQMIDSIIKQKEGLIELVEATNKAAEANYQYAKELTRLAIESKYGQRIKEFNTKNGIENEANTNLMTSILTNRESSTTNKINDELKKYNISDINTNKQLKKFLKDNFGKELDWSGDDDEVLALEYARTVKGAKGNLTYTRDDGGFGHGTVTDVQGNKIVEQMDDKAMRKGVAEYYAKEHIKNNLGSEIDQDKFEAELETMVTKATEFGKQFGTDFSTSMLATMANGSGQFDFSSLFSQINPEEYTKLMGISGEDLMSKFGLTSDMLTQMGLQSAEDFKTAFEEGFQDWTWDMDKALDSAMGNVSNELDTMGLSKKKLEEYSDEVKTYARNLMAVEDQQVRLEESADGVANTLQYDAEAAVKVSLSVVKMNKAIDKLADNMKDWSSIIKKSSTTSQEAAEAYRGVAEAVGDIYNVESDYISNSFIQDHLAEIEKIATGDADAIEKLRDELSKDILLNIITINKINTDELKTELLQDLTNLESMIDDIEVGASIDVDNLSADEQKMIDVMQDIINKAGMTAEQANALFSTMGFDTEFATEMQPVERMGASTIESSRVIGNQDFNITDMSGEPIKVTRPIIETFTTRGTPYKYTDYVESVAMSTQTEGSEKKTPTIKKLTKTGTGSMNNYSAKNAGGGSPGKSSGGGGSSSKPSKEKPLEKETDPYHDVNIQLALIGSKLKLIQSQNDKAFGAKKIENYNKQLQLLNNKLDQTKEKLKIAEREQARLGDLLANRGAIFNADGTLANYEQLYQQELAKVNAMIDNYNNMSKEEQEAYKDTLDAAKEDFSKFEEQLKDYDDTVSNLIPQLQQDIQDAIDEQIELQIKKFNMEFEIHLDMTEAHKDWNEFKKKILDGIKDDDIFGNARARAVDDMSVYLDENGNGQLAAGLKQTQEVLAELREMDETGWSSVYGDNRTKALEDLQTAYKDIEQSMLEMQQIQEDVHQAWLDTMDEINDKMSEQVKMYEQISNIIEHDKKVIELVYGETDFDALGRMYEAQHQNNLELLEFQRMNADFWRKEMDSIVDKNSEEWKKARDNWIDAVNDLNATIEDSIENIRDKLENTIDRVFDKFNKQITNGKGLDYVEQQWDLINDKADDYLDTVNAAFGIRDIERKYQNAIDATDNVGAQRKLNELMQKELESLRSKDKLTEYDIERAQKRYDLEVKRLALEEAQNTKTKMRLRRDSQGNYRYEYVADEDNIRKLQEEVDALENSLYNFDKERFISLQNEIVGYVRDREEAIKEIQMDASLTEEERQARLAEINQLYNDLIQDVTDQTVTAQTNLYESGADELRKIWDQQSQDFNALNEEQQRIMVEEMIPQFESGVHDMIEAFKGPEGFEAQTTESMDALSQATKDYEDNLREVQDAAGEVFDDIEAGIDKNIPKTEELIQENEELHQVYEDQIDAIKELNAQLTIQINKYKTLADEAKRAAEEAYNYWMTENKIAAERAAQEKANSGAGSETSNNANNSSNNGGTGSGGSSGSDGDGVLSVGDYATYTGGAYYSDSYGGGPSGNRGPGRRVKITAINNNGSYPIHVYSTDSAYGWLKKNQLSGYDTGGYTGDWGSDDGKLALLHQKELVLNKEDTQNMLDMMKIARDVIAAAGPNTLNLNPGRYQSDAASSDSLEQNVHIEANFPNVETASEIEEALNNLVNLAAQRANRKMR